MAEFLAYRVVIGKLTIDKIPLILKDKVKQAIVNLDYTKPAESEEK